MADIDKKILANGLKRRVSVLPDFPDLRDRIYEPSLIELKESMTPDYSKLIIRDQLEDGACVGFALAAVINLQNRISTADPKGVSPRMLYEMAKFHDEWDGENYNWSSLRGSIKGMFHNGVCSETEAPFAFRPDDDDRWTLTAKRADEARQVGLGAYFRLRPSIIDYHVALNEVGAIAVSAITHSGWANPKKGRITKRSRHEGGHAFAIIGYDDTGFIIQNSWGEDWGGFRDNPGVAHWSYEDWAENIVDAWVLRLAVPTPRSFGVVVVSREGRQSVAAEQIAASPRGYEVLHHYLHLDDGKFVNKGRYPTNFEAVKQIAQIIEKPVEPRKVPIKHVLIYAHGGLNDAKASARRIRGMKAKFLANGIYPIHMMWETGFTEELFDVIGGVFKPGVERVGSLRDGFDRIVERMSRSLGQRLWREMKNGAVRSFKAGADGARALKHLLHEIDQMPEDIQVHLVGHSAGSILLGELIRGRKKLFPEGMKPASLTLMAPACSVDFYDEVYKPALDEGFIGNLQQFNLTDRTEQDDSVGPYGKSLLYLVSRAFDSDDPKKPQHLLGMEKYTKEMTLHANHKLFYAGRSSAPSKSKTHGGFDNDTHTMNNLLATILGSKPSGKRRFNTSDLSTF